MHTHMNDLQTQNYVAKLLREGLRGSQTNVGGTDGEGTDRQTG